MSYKLRCTIDAHSNDVRAIATMDNCIISGSRDNTVKLWTEAGNTYDQTAVLLGHTNYVSAVAVLPASDSYPFGLIISGSHDCTINGYHPYTSNPAITMRGHQDTVSSLTPSLRPDCFLSTSWDKTALVWNAATSNIIIKLTGHTLGVWCAIEIPEGFIITGAADKTLRVYGLDGTCVNVLEGHDLCIRGLAYIGDDTVMSGSNDGTLRKWKIPSGECLDVLKVHKDYIYSVVTSFQDQLIAFVGESNLLSVWQGENVEDRQNIHQPANSVWAVSILPNSDIVTGSSDGRIRIYTKDPARFASKKEIDEHQISAVRKIAKDPNSKIQGLEAISTPGKYNLETRILEDNWKIYLFEWHSKDREWKVLEEHQKDSTKQLHNGKLYDHVFSIDIDGKETYKLPFNNTDNPLFAAQKFIIENRLSPDFLDRIVKFIQESSGTTYNGDGPAIVERDTVAYEPRTYYPPKDYVIFRTHDIALIKNKLCTHMQQMHFTEKEITKVTKLLSELLEAKEHVSQDSIDTLINALENWNENLLFPVLDIARIVCQNKFIHNILFNEENGEKFMACLDRFFNKHAGAHSKIFLFRILTNMFSGSKGEDLIFSRKVELLSHLPSLLVSDAEFINDMKVNPNNLHFDVGKGTYVIPSEKEISSLRKKIEVAAATFIINLSLAATKKRDIYAVHLCYNYIRTVLVFTTDPEASFRLLVALGTVGVVKHFTSIDSETVTIINQISQWDSEDPIKRKAVICATNIIQDMEHRPPE